MAQIIVQGNDNSKQVCQIRIHAEIDFNNGAMRVQDKLLELAQRIEALCNEMELPVSVSENRLKDELFIID